MEENSKKGTIIILEDNDFAVDDIKKVLKWDYDLIFFNTEEKLNIELRDTYIERQKENIRNLVLKNADNLVCVLSDGNLTGNFTVSSRNINQMKIDLFGKDYADNPIFKDLHVLTISADLDLPENIIRPKNFIHTAQHDSYYLRTELWPAQKKWLVNQYFYQNDEKNIAKLPEDIRLARESFRLYLGNRELEKTKSIAVKK